MLERFIALINLWEFWFYISFLSFFSFFVNPLLLRKKIENTSDYDITMLKTEYIEKVEVLQKGKIDDIVLPVVSISQIQKKEVYCYFNELLF